jgi:hypothetical protein
MRAWIVELIKERLLDAANQLHLLQAPASPTVPKSLEINGELRKTG